MEFYVRNYSLILLCNLNVSQSPNLPFHNKIQDVHWNNRVPVKGFERTEKSAKYIEVEASTVLILRDDEPIS